MARRFAIFLLMAGLAACGGSSEGVTGGGGGGSASGGTGGAPPDAGTSGDGAPAAAGRLRVDVVGLPQDASPLLIVAGPDDFSRRLLAAGEIEVPPGDYVVEAYAISADGMGYVPDADVRSATVTAGSGGQVLFSYAPLPAKVRDNARVLDPATAGAIDGIVATGERSALTFDAMTPQLAGLKPGDVIVIGQTAATPRGFIGRVTDVDGLVVHTDAASIQDVLEDGVLHFQRAFTVADVAAVTPIDNGIPFSIRICNALTASLPASRGIASAALSVTGELCFTPSASMSLRLTPFRFSFDVGAALDVGLTAEAVASVSIGVEVPILTVALTSFTIWTGPVPWVVTPEFSIVVGASGQIRVGVTTGMRAGVWASGGFTYEDKKFSTRSNSGSSFEFNWPEPIAEAEVKAYGGPNLTFLINGLGGPSLGIEGYARFYVNFLQGVIWDLYAGVDFKAGLATNKFINLSWETSLYKYEKLLATSRQPPAPATKLASRPGFSGTQNPALGPNGAIILPRDGELVSLTEGGTRNWTFTTGEYMLEPTVGPDGTVYVPSFAGKIYAVNGATGARRWELDAQQVGFPSLALGPWLYARVGDSVIAIDPANGAEKWRITPADRARGVAVNKDGTAIYVSSDTKLSASNAMTGVTIWSTTLPGDLFGGSGAQPTVGPDGTIYLAVYPSGIGGGVHVAGVRPDGTLLPARAVGAYDEESTAVTVGSDGSLYLCNLKTVAGLLKNGTIWRTRLKPGYNCDGAPTLDAKGRLLVTDAETIYSIEATTGRILWQQPMGRSGEVNASPLLLPNNHVVIPNEQALWIFANDAGLAPGTWARGGGNGSNTRRAP